MQTTARESAPAATGVSVRQLRDDDLEAADRILRDAFGSFTGAGDIFGTRDFVGSRWRTRPEMAIAADADGRLAGSNFVTDWGSFGFFGPLTVEPALWDRGIAKALLETTLDILQGAGPRHMGLFTFPQSPKHLGLYQRFGFWPRLLTPILARELAPAAPPAAPLTYASLDEADREEALKSCAALTDALSDGLDLGREIAGVAAHGLGDTVLCWAGDRLDAFAVCHLGAGTEAGGESCYVKFAAVHPAARDGGVAFERLLDACEALARGAGARTMEAGVNTGCHEAYRTLLARGYRAALQGVAMERPNLSSHHRPGVYVMDDWR